MEIKSKMFLSRAAAAFGDLKLGRVYDVEADVKGDLPIMAAGCVLWQ